ncbi:4Fe-4S dicluster domain-containing protein [Mycobacterium sp. MYCO198283]|uniref:(Fe-S)-binding protein n=1 Tax=Mycobacterium sp. MYCO198283 TaxID=2883505 RepID=UPI001E3D575B|nr:heterodisulfide reductase-related iron-sulfur binding cluster [Mycobacterium sp. MYCO198283]MCG5432107.1 4Fe-4S dicluster domain-containing protein [Mycobacterium sp. MYCO198283]
MDALEWVRLALGLLLTVVVLAFAARRVLFLTRLIRSGQPVSDSQGRKDDIPGRIKAQFTEVFGQKKLLKWSIPGIAHFFTMWGFFILATVYLEAYGVLFDPDFHIPFVGRWDLLGGLQDFFAIAVLAGIIVFSIIRLRSEPKEYGRDSRFYGSHTGGAWLILFMIFNVIWTYLLFRGSSAVIGTLPYGDGAFASQLVGAALEPLGESANHVIETVALLLHIGVMLVFLLIVLHSKHLHIGTAPINVTFKRLPDALGPLLPVEFKGEPVDFEDPAEDAVLGRGKIEDFTWKGYLDMTTCTECGRCQSQCPAWNTGKPLSPKLVIMNLRDHLFAKAPYIIGGQTVLDNTPEGGLGEDLKGKKEADHHAVPESGFERVLGSGPEQATRPLVGTLEQGGVIDPDVLWSCTTCGACVEQCPVDIEHIDHIVDMRRYQVMMESEFPGELGVLYKNLETKGNPWGQNASARTAWIDEVDFDVPVFGRDVDSFAGYEYLFFVGCAGAYEDRAKKTTKAVAELLSIAGVKFLVLGEGETCNGDSARRSGNEFLFQQLAAQNVETLNDLFDGVERVDRKVVVTCPHCFNTLGREYPQLGGNYTVLHHTQLLNRLVRDKLLVPVKSVTDEPVTYHDPCYLGRHNKEYSAPRELVGASGATLTEMPRHADRGLCCGAGGARMWMEEHIGKRVNHERVDEALATDATKIATGCPFCRVMITDGVGDRAAEVPKAENVEVLDVAQLLLGSLDLSGVTLPEKGTAAKEAEKRAAEAPATATATTEAPAKEEAAPQPPAAPAAAAKPATAAPPAKGLGIAGGAKRPGAKKAAPKADTPHAEDTSVKQQPNVDPDKAEAGAAAKAPVKGLGLAAGAKRPGAKKAAAPKAAEQAKSEPAVEEQSTTRDPQVDTKPAPTKEPAKAEPAVKGLGIAAGARRPGAKKAASGEPKTELAPAPTAEQSDAAGAQSDAQAEADGGSAGNGEAPKPEPPVKGLGIARGVRPPGKR